MQVFAKGDRGNEVVDIQLKLAALGYDLGVDGADGSFGTQTEKAVKEFQSSRGLSPTGVVDYQTWRALVEASYKLGDRLLYLKTPYFKGDDVKELQLALNTLGFNTGKVDGIYGQSTERAVREFQYNYGLTRDGIFGPSTLEALRNLSYVISGRASKVFPNPEHDRHSRSVISVFEGKKIAIELGLSEDFDEQLSLFSKEQSDNNKGDNKTGILIENEFDEDITYDLGMRLGNLLELLGAKVVYINRDEVVEESKATEEEFIVEAYIAFGLNISRDKSIHGSTIYFRNTSREIEEKSRLLAMLVQKEIIQSLGSFDHGIIKHAVEPKITTNSPAILVKPLYLTNPKEKKLLNAEIFRQKIAVAVFDGISNYLRKQ